MKLISLNIWGGREFDVLISFLKTHAENTDIFCFQEVLSSSESVLNREKRMNVLGELERIFPDHHSFFTPVQDNITVHIPSTFGQAIFAKKSLPVQKQDFVFTRGGRNTMKDNDLNTLGVGFQYILLKNGGNPLAVVNIHGPAIPGDKLDTPDRLALSQKIEDFLKNIGGQKIVCGDFNLMPKTHSIKILEKNMKNLINEYNIPTTRSMLNTRKYPKNPQLWADYLFISPEIDIVSFEVPDISISDHLPLILVFS